MAKLVDVNNPARKYEPPLCRFVSAIPLEVDALTKRGKFPVQPYKMDPEPCYSRPARSERNRISLLSMELQVYTGKGADGETSIRKSLVLKAVEANIGVELGKLEVKVFHADRSGVGELQMDRRHLVLVPRGLARRIFNCLYPKFEIYIVGQGRDVIRAATSPDFQVDFRSSEPMFLLGRHNLFVPCEIRSLEIHY